MNDPTCFTNRITHHDSAVAARNRTTENERTDMSSVTPVTDAQFKTDVLDAEKPVLVDFWAEWCGPCRAVSPVIDEIAGANSEKMSFRKMNVDENPQTPSTYRITSIPTLNVYRGGELVKSIVGARPKSALLADLAEFL